MSTDTPGPGPRRVRASDAEREELAQVLRAAMTEGRLSLEEGEERLAKTYAATYRDELGPLTGDLPDGGRQAWYAAQFEKPEFVAAARRHLRGHIGFVTVVAAGLVGLWALSGAHFFWPAIPLFFLFFSVFRHARWRRWQRYWAAQQGGGGPWGHRGGRGQWGPPWAR
jgi:hypothetical protein